MCPNKGPKKKFSKGKPTAQDDSVQPTDLSSTCCVPRGQVSCHNPEILDKTSSIRFLCSNPQCPQSGLMHEKCFDKFESLGVSCLGKHLRCRDWSDKQKLSSLWINRGYGLIFKMCACECGHGHIRRDLDFEEEQVHRAAAAQAGQEKKKKKKSAEVVKPTLNVRRDKVSQKSVGNFSYNKHPKTGKSLKPAIDEFEASQCIPGLQPARPPLKLNLNLSALKPKKAKMIKGKKGFIPKSSSNPEDNDEDGWTTVSKGPSKRETGGAAITTNKKRPKKDSKVRQLVTEELLEVYQSDEGNISDNDGFSSIDDVSYGTNCVETKVVGVSDAQIEEMLGNLVEEKLIEEISKKKALAEVNSLVEQNSSMREAFIKERNRLLEDIQTLNLSNMELREASEAREHMLQMQIDELQKTLDEEVHSRNSLLEQNNYLNSLVKCVEDEKEKSVASLAVARMEWKEQIVQAADMVKVHEETSLHMLEKEKMKIMRSVKAMEERLESLSSTADTLRENIEIISTTNIESEEKLATERNLVKDLREQLETERKAEILRKHEVEVDPAVVDFSQDQKDGVLKSYSITTASQLGVSADSKDFSSQDSSMMMGMLDTVREEARLTNNKVEMLEGQMQSLQWKQMLMEKKLVNSQMKKSDTGDNRLDSMKEMILDLVRDCDQIGERSSRMAVGQDRAHQQIEALGDGVDQQILENKSLRVDFAKFEEQMAALQVDMKRDRNQKQTWDVSEFLIKALLSHHGFLSAGSISCQKTGEDVGNFSQPA